ncbi:DarT ssDNA thymidine ADP-ribosyltransferase family protein [Romboutsia sp. 1001216sp1]|uniref:DarT ssDNA thymidine ADP-ribosyltransferase family protein n=1 Tax=Romboutsia sp. 1001216sp1 TaxID=2986997 RepID=UPI00233026D7|nr:DarT ssDNA thymidine ADP-ribosyltransferase family protein [Romboutsia sp. 1001216sp1]MDB8803598.1 DarT ssDNA thymidine ADP-ribosyltransferase family protein [Romboutsia sp. 1001216sp1]MDB8807900.1 DarT ssDNA thymidine ADP-ribosyltransferase family protein [Romboutsia sp. 1001216sp1]MDB8809246.1 DarT ssDNA thymidine ADP-ribosyltransferase family protein [Romboutsia sp. 1001216sp1]MDB8814994.1 DarT ssDNA thymidine ADP-ribosyltransferase family protein [Romboutsia sp. 1001216sp1]MDB8819727.1 
MNYKKDSNYIKKYVGFLKQQYNFKGLYHFTDFENLESIFKSGYLYSRNGCNKNKIIFKDGANHDVLDKAQDTVHDSVRLYYRPKTPTLYDNEGVKLKEYCDKIHIPMPVYLLFDEELLYLDTTKFSNGNATRSDIGCTYEFFQSMDWSAIFHSTWFYPEERDYIVNKRHAELLSSKPISIDKYLKSIIFRCEADRKRAINVYGHNSKYEVDLSIFSDKNTGHARNDWQENNFVKDYNICYEFYENLRKKKLIIEIEFQKLFTDYDIQFVIEDVNGVNITKNKNYIYKIEKIYIDEFGNKCKTKENCKKGLIEISGNIEEIGKFYLYINGILYIDEDFLKEEIRKYEMFLKEQNNEKFIFTWLLKNNKSLNYIHRYEILDINNNIIKSRIIDFGDYKESVSWKLTLDDYNENWYKIKYYIDDIVYIHDTICNKKVICTEE